LRNAASPSRVKSVNTQDQFRLRNTNPTPGTNGPLIPGDPEREAETIRSKEGIPLIKPVLDDLLDISKKTGISFEVK
jgi:L-2-hydroxycarboxylate dehydrogenase (NAD+)